MAKISIKEIKELANEKNWELLSDVYKNLDTPLTFKCSEGHQILLPYKKVRNKWLCPVCNQNTFFQMDEKVLAKPKGARRIIALDQSTHITGYSIYDNKELIKYGIFEVDGEDEISRDHTLKNWLVSMIRTMEFPNGEFAIDYEEEIILFQKWFLEEMGRIRKENVMTFPVSTISLLVDKDRNFVDKDFAEWACEHNRKWNDSNWFIDDTVTSLSSCCRLKNDITALGYANTIGGAALKVGSGY